MDERILIFLALWSLGLVAGFWMVRRGHDPRWIYLGALLGPIFVPIAVERVRSNSVVVGARPAARRDSGLRVMVGYDGSPESRSAVAAAHRMFEPLLTTIVLAQVVSYDAAEEADHTDVDAARRQLADSAIELGVPEAVLEVLAGPPAETLCTVAREQDIDLLVVGTTWPRALADDAGKRG